MIFERGVNILYNEKLDVKSRRRCFGRIIKSIRHKNGISAEQVVDYLEENDIQSISPSTLYSWENGSSVPNSVTFLALCNLYSIDNLLDTFEWIGVKHYYPAFKITESEYEMILKYRAKPNMHPAIKKILD
jgi:transcriptional regulator with XRE-family HTH domain